MLKDFKEFAIKGNVVDMAVGIMIGGAFGTIVSSLVANIITPPIGLLTGGADFKDHFLVLSGERHATLEATQAAGAVTFNYGLFLNAVISFLIIAWVLFLVIRGINRLKRVEPAAVAEPVAKECPHCCMTIPLKATRCAHCTAALEPGNLLS